jgi:hypothetical protein
LSRNTRPVDPLSESSETIDYTKISLLATSFLLAGGLRPQDALRPSTLKRLVPRPIQNDVPEGRF